MVDWYSLVRRAAYYLKLVTLGNFVSIDNPAHTREKTACGEPLFPIRPCYRRENHLFIRTCILPAFQLLSNCVKGNIHSYGLERLYSAAPKGNWAWQRTLTLTARADTLPVSVLEACRSRRSQITSSLQNIINEKENTACNEHATK
eukprot:1161750-Pelagomonas_calceolata.AAC.5